MTKNNRSWIDRFIRNRSTTFVISSFLLFALKSRKTVSRVNRSRAKLLKLGQGSRIYPGAPWGTGELRQEKEIAARLGTLLPLPELMKRVADFAGVDAKGLSQRGRNPLVVDTKSIICFLAARKIGYSGEIIAKALGITRSGVCRSASRGEVMIRKNPDKWGDVEGLVN